MSGNEAGIGLNVDTALPPKSAHNCLGFANEHRPMPTARSTARGLLRPRIGIVLVHGFCPAFTVASTCRRLDPRRWSWNRCASFLQADPRVHPAQFPARSEARLVPSVRSALRHRDPQTRARFRSIDQRAFFPAPFQPHTARLHGVPKQNHFFTDLIGTLRRTLLPKLTDGTTWVTDLHKCAFLWLVNAARTANLHPGNDQPS